ncbi:MAG: Gfo/Idh/MocA family oxidoreductase [Bryobacterales bacterium]|nr:Gfo/Idh/MocA family oxidoreductase [Bryobacteraceae bacterium]MDW8131558.1 Gfo/Idh/MocA family oxidoreductase [Bryobacterales bacterium]
MPLDFDLEHAARPPARADFGIGIVGAGFVVRDLHLVAYRKAGFRVLAITDLDPDRAREVARLHEVPRVPANVEELLEDPDIEVVDVAVPPDSQPAVLRRVLERGRGIRGVLAQKPLALTLGEARALVEGYERAGIALAVNQNMRWDPSIRALRTLLQRGWLGEPVLATIEMRAPRRYAGWKRRSDRLTLPVMSIHHLDAFRFLFGEPESVWASARTDPRADFPHTDGIVLYVLEYASGLRAAALDDVYAGPVLEGAAADSFVRWRVEGTEGMARGAVGWPAWPNVVPSTLDFTLRSQPGVWFSPRWREAWFPDAFAGTMGELMDALATGRSPAIGGRDNLHTLALVEACYRSLAERRAVRVDEIAAAGSP